MEFIRPELIPDPTVRRMSLYLRQLEVEAADGQQTISSRQIGRSLGLTDAQVRKDLAYFGTFGHPGVGYDVAELVTRIRRTLGTDKQWPVVLVGVGNLGQALLRYGGFGQKGMKLVHAFDQDAAKVGLSFGGVLVHPPNEMKKRVEQEQVRLAIIAVPADEAQSVAIELVSAGVAGLLNFSPVTLTVPSSVAVVSVDLASQLEHLVFQVSLNAMTRSGARHP